MRTSHSPAARPASTWDRTTFRQRRFGASPLLGFLIGVSVGSEGEVPDAAGGDYTGVGPVYGSMSKLDAGSAIGLLGFAHLATAAGLPAVAIGGITTATAADVMAAGAAGIAVIAAIFGASDPEAAARSLRRAIG